MSPSPDPIQPPLRVGVVGLGMIGSGVAASLVSSGVAPWAVYDVRPGAAAGITGMPLQAATAAAVAASCEVVLLAVVTAEQARSVLDGPGGLLEGAHDGLIVVLLSTVAVEAVHDLAALCEPHGVALLDAGVTGGSRAAENGLVVMVGGSDHDVERAMPTLRAFAKTVVHCGGPGTGMVAKLARNAITYGQWAVIREAASLAAAGGVALSTLLDVLVAGDDEGTDRLNLLRGYATGQLVTGEQVEFADLLAQKDLAAAQAFAASARLETPLIDQIRPRMRQVYAGDLDQPLPEDPHDRGLTMMDRAYGKGFSDQIEQHEHIPSVQHTVEQLFAHVWARGFLTLRDRRLFTLGLTTMLGRADLLEVQLRGALARGEFTTPQLRELAVHGLYYAGWGNGTVLQQIVEQLIGENDGS